MFEMNYFKLIVGILHSKRENPGVIDMDKMGPNIQMRITADSLFSNTLMHLVVHSKVTEIVKNEKGGLKKSYRNC